MPSLYEPRLKADRARKHLADLDASISTYINGNSYEITAEAQAGPEGVDVAVFACQRQPAPIYEWASLLGDFAANARSALNFLIYQLSLPTNPDPQGTDFPIFLEEPNPGRQKAMYDRCVAYLTDAQKAVILGLQPYKRGNPPELDTLWLLQDFNNPDKHTTFVILGEAVQAPGIRFGQNSGFYIQQVTLNGQQILDEKTEVARLLLIPVAPNPRMDVQATLMRKVAFGDGTPAKGELVLPMLYKIMAEIDRVISLFENDLPSS